MKRLILPLIGVVAVACSSPGGGASNTPGQTSTTPPATSEATTIPANATGYAAVQPIFAKNCTPCHGDKSHAGGLVLLDYDALMKGGDDGAVVKPGDPENSILIHVLHGPNEKPRIPAMPMRRAPLAAADIQKITDWVKAGAKK